MKKSKEKKTNENKKAQIEIPDREAALIDRRFWTVRIEPGTVTDLAKYITAGTMIMKNHGPDPVMVDTGYAADDVRLRPGQVQIMATRNQIRVATTGALPALVEFEFIPGLK
jgi:hypothetical protein